MSACSRSASPPRRRTSRSITARGEEAGKWRLETEGDTVDGGRWIRFRSFQQKGGNFNELKTGDTAEILGIKRRYVIAIMKGGRGDLEVVRTNHGPRGL